MIVWVIWWIWCLLGLWFDRRRIKMGRSRWLFIALRWEVCNVVRLSFLFSFFFSWWLGGVVDEFWESFFIGYRHLPLHDSQLSQYLFSTLFVKMNVISLWFFFASFNLKTNKSWFLRNHFVICPPVSLSFHDSEDIFFVGQICIIVFLFFFKKKKSSFRVFEFYQTFITIPILSFLPSREVVIWIIVVL